MAAGGVILGDLPPYEAFPIGGTNSVRGYSEGGVGSGRNYVAGTTALQWPIFGPVEVCVIAAPSSWYQTTSPLPPSALSKLAFCMRAGMDAHTRSALCFTDHVVIVCTARRERYSSTMEQI